MAKKTPEQNNTQLIQKAVREWISTKATMAMLEKKLEDLRAVIETAAVFELGSNTGHFESEGCKFTVARRFNESWDQEKLKTVHDTIGSTRFFQAFKYEYKPLSKKAVDAFASADPEMEKAISWCRTVKPGKASITYENLNPEPEPLPAEAEG